MKIALFLLGYIIYKLFTANLPIIEVLTLIIVICAIVSYIITKSLEDALKPLRKRKR